MAAETVFGPSPSGCPGGTKGSVPFNPLAAGKKGTAPFPGWIGIIDRTDDSLHDYIRKDVVNQNRGKQSAQHLFSDAQDTRPASTLPRCRHIRLDVHYAALALISAYVDTLPCTEANDRNTYPCIDDIGELTPGFSGSLGFRAIAPSFLVNILLRLP